MRTSICMPSDAVPPSAQDAGLALRLAQRAAAALLDARDDLPALARAQRSQALRRCLSALSADDRVRFARWLALLRASRQGLATRLVAQVATADMPSRRPARQAQAAA